MIARALATATLATVVASCASLVKVKDKDDNDVAGIPFYVKNEYFRQETVYRQTWYRLTLTVHKKVVDTKDGKEELLDRGTQNFTVEVLKYNDEKIVALKKSILAGDTSDVLITNDLIDQFNNLPQRGDKTNENCIKNGIVSEWQVDDSRTYYLNGPLPWFGTGSLTQELNGDGTLSKAISTADTKLAEGIASWIPLKEYLTGEFIEPATEAAKDDQTMAMIAEGVHGIVEQGGTPQTRTKQLVYILSLAIEEVGYETTLTGDPADSRPAKTPGPLALNAKDVAFFRKPLEEKKEEKKDDAPTIGISGSIKLPKP